MRKNRKAMTRATLSAAYLTCFLAAPHLGPLGAIGCAVIGLWIHSYASDMDFRLATPADVADTSPAEGTPVDPEPWRHPDGTERNPHHV